MFMHLALHHEVQWIGNRHLSFWLRCLIRLQTAFEQISGKKRGYSHFNKWHCKLKAKYVERKLKNSGFDFIFSSNSPDYVAYLNTDIPIIYSRDTTFELFVDYYPTFFGLKKKEIEEGNEIERLAIQKSAKIIYSSEWAARSAIDFYGADKSKVVVLHFGANLIYEPGFSNIHAAAAQGEVCNLLFVGVEWKRKGGEVAYRTFKRLKSEGFNCKLFVVGCKMKASKGDPDVEHYPFLNKNRLEEFHKLYEIYSKSHFLLLPTIADCTPIVFSEAAAFGIPVITTDTGGNSSVVHQGVNGYLVPVESDETFYAEIVKTVFSNKKLYASLRRKSRNEFDRRLSWKIWINEVNKLLCKTDSSGVPGASKEEHYYEEGY
jgi:glycosyltransferase involved in cell wall biosynthesis